MVSPLRGGWFCSVCAREVAAITPGLAGPLGYCSHGPAADDKPRAMRLVPVLRSEAEARELIERRLDRQALLRALQKAHTAEGRMTLTSREARVLEAHTARANPPT